ncbi:beta-1,3-galactosyltransferase 2 [Solea solea]|uniref:beta-1,3-galactosyltransferase 2 n=1 Tax=Solea solea TaxID=90069 RepID=UPI0027297FD7|nr:beta-1,3-galactosyltransferase 2 [Solea solea]
MRRALHCWTLVKLLGVSAVLVLSVHVLLKTKDVPRSPRPLTDAEFALVSPLTYRFVHNQPAVCARSPAPFLLFLVPVSPQEAEARGAIRRTWSSPSAPPSPHEETLTTLTLFFMGVTEDRGQVSSLQEESTRHSDIIQMDFLDTYQNLTVKTVMMMNWASTFCPNASYVMKVDADIFVNVFFLLPWLRNAPRRGFIAGSVIGDGRPRRDRNSKWSLTEDQFPEDRFPPYVSGAGYVLSADLASRIAWASRFVRVVPLEDVYVGLCLRVLGVRPSYALAGFTLRNLFEIRNLEYDRCVFSRLIIVNGFKPGKLLRAWQDFSTRHNSC